MRNHILIWLGIMMIFIGGFIVGRTTVPANDPQMYEVIEKFINDGRFYIETVIEVEPEDYIGLEVGDEFEVRE